MNKCNSTEKGTENFYKPRGGGRRVFKTFISSIV